MYRFTVKLQQKQAILTVTDWIFHFLGLWFRKEAEKGLQKLSRSGLFIKKGNPRVAFRLDGGLTGFYRVMIRFLTD